MKTHIVARKLFTDLSDRLRNEDFYFAGHKVMSIIFAEKPKAEESRSAEKYNLGTKHGYTLRRGTPGDVVMTDRLQGTRTIKVSPIQFDEGSDIDGLFEEIAEKAPTHFDKNNPVPIKELITKHIHTGSICTWRKVKIQVAPGRDEWRLLLDQIDGSDSFDLDHAEEVAEGMIETVCETVEQTLRTRNVCSMIANR